MADFKYFKIEDFDCQESGNNRMQEDFIHALDQLRAACGFPFHVTSGYRDPEGHSIEKAKAKPGTHAQGIAADIAVSGGVQRRAIVNHALAMGMSVGVAKTFVHVDIRKTTPVLWCY
jgi:zinc D-Ala-D-Ala carboxypeptidase